MKISTYIKNICMWIPMCQTAVELEDKHTDGCIHKQFLLISCLKDMLLSIYFRTHNQGSAICDCLYFEYKYDQIIAF